MAQELTGSNKIDWSGPASEFFVRKSITFGRDLTGVGEIQVCELSMKVKPSKSNLEAAWRERGAGNAMPVVLAAEFQSSVWLLGPSSSDALVGPLPFGRAYSQLQALLDEPDGISARKLAQTLLNSATSSVGLGFTNHFLFAAHHLKNNVPRRSDWNSATEIGQSLLDSRGRALIDRLGFDLSQINGDSANVLVLRSASGNRRAIAVLLDESEQFDQRSVRYQISPVARGLEVAGREDVPWVIVLRQSALRLYPGRDGVGVGQRGQSETFFELDLNLIDPVYAGLLPLIFSADALESGGTAEEILRDSGKYAAELGTRLRDRVYENVVPPIAIAIAERLPNVGYEIDDKGLDFAYSLTLRVLFRLLFQAYGEDTGLLPAGRNEGYDSNSLQAFIKRDVGADFGEYSPEAKTLWLDLTQVWDAIYTGNQRWAVPPYGGSLFDDSSAEGGVLKRLELPDSIMGPALQYLLSEITEEGVKGPVDFRSLQVRDFGTIYEGLLESSLSLADMDLTVDENGIYVPSVEGQPVHVPRGRPYFHSASGARKATGSFYTPKILVDHLIEKTITPGLSAHLVKVKALCDAGKDRDAAELFWDYRVADLAMGSAHFLVAAVDKIERMMRDFLTVTPVPGVRLELERLSEKARSALGRDLEAAGEIGDAQLLRRQVARRCVYGLDINPLAVELARLAIWIHTFVPGLPMSSLDHNLVLGNSLTGIGTVDEALIALDVGPLLEPLVRKPLEVARDLLLDYANASEADRLEVREGAALLAKASLAAEPVRAIFDVAIATRLGIVPKGSNYSTEEFAVSANSAPVVVALDGLNPGHLPHLFPEVFMSNSPGFDALIGNPPWDKIRHEPQQFWTIRDPGLRSLEGDRRNDRIEELRRIKPIEKALEDATILHAEKLAHFVENAYDFQSRGHHELAKVFAERYLKLLRKDGTLGVVLPWAMFSLAGWKKLRKEYLRQGRLDVLPIRNRGGWAFPNVHPQTSIGIFNFGPGEGVCFHVAADSAEVFEQRANDLPVQMSGYEFDQLSDESQVPWFNSPGDARVFAKLIDAPSLGSGSGWVQGKSDSSRWDFSASGAHAKQANQTPDPSAWRVTMTRHVSPYVMSPTKEGKWITGIGELAKLGRGLVLDQITGAFTLGDGHPAIVFRFPSGNDNSRTLIAAALPPSGWLFSAGYAHGLTLLGDKIGDIEKLALLGYLNSVVADWWARRFVDRHVGARIIEGLRLPNWSSEQRARVAELAASILRDNGAHQVATIASLPSESTNISSSDALAEIDALAAQGFGLSIEDVEAIFEDFTLRGVSQNHRDSVLRQLKANG